jgi:hypothetical protein
VVVVVVVVVDVVVVDVVVVVIPACAVCIQARVPSAPQFNTIPPYRKNPYLIVLHAMPSYSQTSHASRGLPS